MRRRTLALCLATSFVLSLSVALPAGATQPWCGIYWGSTPSSDYIFRSTTLVDVRAGQHACFDRLVVDFDGPQTGHFVHYTDTIREGGSGNEVEAIGGAKLELIVFGAAHDQEFNPTFDPAGLPSVDGFRTFRDVVWAGSFEGQSTLGLGVRGRLPFRVFVLDGAPGNPEGSRIVIDVAHYWYPPN